MKVLVREKIADAGVELLRAKFDVDVDGESDLAETIGQYDAIVIRSATKLTAELIERAGKLKVIGRAGVGVDNVDVEAATRHGILVANAPESTVVSAAEHTIGLLVALARNVPQAHAALKQGRWERSKWGGVELAGKTLAVLGFGRIGQQVARRALGLGMHVVAHDPFVGPERYRELGVERADSNEAAIAEADFLTLHAPLTPETRGMVGREQLALLRPNAVVVNDARGPILDIDALADLLRDGHIAAAGLDVLPQEPPVEPIPELLRAYRAREPWLEGRLVVTPHSAWLTPHSWEDTRRKSAETMRAALLTNRPQNVISPEMF